MLELVAEKKARLAQQMEDIKVVLMELNTAERICKQTLANIEKQDNGNNND